MGRRRGQSPAAAPVAAARALPPGFGEYPPGDPRYVGLTDAEQSGVRPELLAAPVTGPVQGEVVQRRPPTAYMVDIERGNPDNPELDMVDIEREATLIFLAAIATKEGPTEGGGDAGGPGTAAGVTPQLAHGGAKDAGGPDPPSGKDGEEGGGQEASGGGEVPSQEYESAAESGKKSTGAGEASAGGEAVTVKRAAVTGRAMMKAKATPTLRWRWSWSTPLWSSMRRGSAKGSPTSGHRRRSCQQGEVSTFERLQKAIEKGFQQKRDPTGPANIGPNVFRKPRKVKGRVMDAGWAQMGHGEVVNFLMHLGRFYFRVVRRKMPDNPAKAAARKEISDYVAQALLACFEPYEEDMEKRQAEAKKGKRVAPNLSEAFQFYARAALPFATNTPETQNDGTDAQDGPVWPNPDMEQQRQGVSQRRLQAEGL
jgi:hypothetical protein